MSKSDKEQMKLQEGDYVTDLTKEQWDELLSIEAVEYRLTYDKHSENGLVCESRKIHSGLTLYHYLHSPLAGTELSFADFRQRAINTFVKWQENSIK